jgi:hypothetical protein
MKRLLLTFLFCGSASALAAQQAGLERRPAELLDAVPPSARVAGTPGQMAVRERGCRSFPPAEVRRRIVELAIQEWAFFGFSVVDRTDDGEEDGEERGRGWRRRGGDPAEAARVASSIGGYWAVTPDGAWILDSQNEIWRRTDGQVTRWRYAWSAAFVSWVMCESGLAGMDQFRRDVAHHRYIDQAIRARGARGRAAFVAHEPGEAEIAPGDLLCSARRPAYRTLAERRRQMGAGARTHCDIVVKVDPVAGRVFTIGGNVRGTVGLKVFPAARAGGVLRVVDPADDRGGRPLFAHLELDRSYGAADVFDGSPAVRALSCGGPGGAATWRTAAALVAPECAR